ncbi:M23 family metallopeptidase [Jannaschia sp. S6380]|uniref:M23 family metallopeptidase n=1 Tax=Jannaschia sp. S6380 TaxID=2926408 RepID=UPI001FF37396|nr:M23 family metallopeptidase [Jannaschia sp. S6380]MCK0166158.1 M23 family metallopeptidase [Jannaschia sp. S6380]
MRLRYLAAGLTVAGGASMAAVGMASFGKEPVPPALAAAAAWQPEMPTLPPPETLAPDLVALPLDSPPGVRPPVVLAAAAAPAPMLEVEPPLPTWSREVAPGETLDAVLAEAGLAAADRAEAALALGAEYDLRRLRPGHGVDVVKAPEGGPRAVTLRVDDGVRIEASFGARPVVRVMAPEPEIVSLAGETRVESSLFAALDAADMPARFAVDLAQMLGGAVDFRRDLGGGETLRVMWREARVGDDLVGQPELAFAALDLGDALFEVAWPEDGTGRATIYLDGEVQRIFAQPVEGARLSSVFGRRVHPVFGNVRMHTGVDFAAAQGTPVRATAPGRVSFVGWRGGYGRVVEIAHDPEIMTRYAHLSAVPGGLSEGQRVAAGDMIGRVGATGTATGPNLHYEVRVDGRPTDPLSDERLAEAAEHDGQADVALERLAEARATLEDALTGASPDDPNERL